MSIQTQWSLSETSESAIKVARGILQAATTDNVQALAILTCERFGATIAMSQDTRRKVELSVLPTQEPAAISFIKSTVGYSAHDCVSVLGKSLAGVQFIALAAALVTTMGPFKGGVALQLMLEVSAVDKTLVPTVRHLDDLLKSIESRCHRSGFADDVAGWQMFLHRYIRASNNRLELFWKGCSHYPRPQAVEKLVDAFRQLRRIGNPNLTKVIVRTTACAPWTIAFSKWCLGFPPSVLFEDGTPLLEQDGSDVSVVIIEQGDLSAFDVTIHSSVDAPSTLITSRIDQKMENMMINVKAYGSMLLQSYNFDDIGYAARAVKQLLPYALRQVVKCLEFSGERMLTDYSILVQEKRDDPLANEDLSELRMSPFPDDYTISRAQCLLVGLESPGRLRSLDTGLLVSDLPLVAIFLDHLKENCLCSECSGDSESVMKCEKVIFFGHISFIIADILALSLFHCPESLLVAVSQDRSGSHQFVQVITHILAKGTRETCAAFSVLKWALQLVGHRMKPVEHLWVLSCYKGQAVWPSIYETHSYSRRGYLCLSWLPGNLQYNGDNYHEAREPIYTQEGADPVTNGCEDVVSEPRNYFPDLNIDWSVATADGAIEVSLGLRDPIGTYSHVTSCPTYVLANLATALLVECCHKPDTKLDAPDRFSSFTGPLKPVRIANEDRAPGLKFSLEGSYTMLNNRMVLGKGYSVSTRHTDEENVANVSVVAVDGSNELRFFAISKNKKQVPMVLRKGACIQCCLDVCRKAGYTVLVL